MFHETLDETATDDQDALAPSRKARTGRHKAETLANEAPLVGGEREPPRHKVSRSWADPAQDVEDAPGRGRVSRWRAETLLCCQGVGRCSPPDPV